MLLIIASMLMPCCQKLVCIFLKASFKTNMHVSEGLETNVQGKDDDYSAQE